MEIELKDMEFYAMHGFYPSEKLIGGRFLVSVQMKIKDEKACDTDQLSDALNYQDVYDIVREEMSIPSNLLEHVCSRIINRVSATFQGIENVSVWVSKMNPPLGGQTGKVTVSLTRS